MRFPDVHLIVALPFVVSALAQPEPEKLSPRSPSGSITIPISQRNKVRNEDGTVNMSFLKARSQRSGRKLVDAMLNYARNTGASTNDPGPSLSSRRSLRTATEPIVDYQESFWHGAIEVGYPPRKFQVDFDTGSSDLFLASTLCTTNCDGRTLYDPGASRTAIDLKKTANSTYGGGDWVFVEQYNDTVSVAGVTARNQTLGAVLTETAGFNATNFPIISGILGMGYQATSVYNASPFFQTLVAQGDVAQAQFSFYLADNGSEITLGGTNPTRYKGDFTYLEVTGQSYWQCDLGSVQVGGQPVQFSDHRAIMDTGTTNIIANESVVAAVYAQIPGSAPLDPKFDLEGYYTFPCNSSIVLSFMFGGKDFLVPPDFFSLGSVDNTNTTCVGGLFWSPILLAEKITFWVMGDMFLRNYYTLFDMGENSIGLAELN